MPELATKAFGKIDVKAEQIIHFPEGIFGFKDHLEFALIEESEDSPFKWLQSTKDENLAFVVIQPELFLPAYSPEVSISELNVIDVKSPSECIIFAIVTIPENNPEKMTANLQGPVLINTSKKLGKQSISNNESHLVRVFILEQLDG